MATFFDDLCDRFGELHVELSKAVHGLTPKALDWKPAEGANSMAVIIVHALGAERYWIGDVALGDPSGRVREEEFKVHGLTAEELESRIAAADAYTRQALRRFTLADLEAERTSRRDGKRFSVGWCLTHALEHDALHVGHVQLTRELVVNGLFDGKTDRSG
jgi:uncharacterized damage-inducible protein DinB